MLELDGLLGRRVTLRHRIGERDGRPLFSDAVGDLVSGDAATVLVQTARGPVRVSRDSVVAVRAIPPPAPRRPSWAAVARLDGICADAWPALVDQPLGGWRLRAAGGFTTRANAAVALGDPGIPLPDALDRVRAFAAEHDLPPRIQVPVGSPWEAAVRREGWSPDTGPTGGPAAQMQVQVLVAELAGIPDREVADASVSVQPEPDADWWRLVLGRPDGRPSPVERSVIAPDSREPLGYGVARNREGTLGAVRAIVVDEHLYVARLAVAQPYRRRGVGTALMAAAARWAEHRGARWCVLQTMPEDDGMQEFYRQLGFVAHHRCHYLSPAAAHTGRAAAHTG